jgi:hypothetical protein
MRIPMWAIFKVKINFFNLLSAEKLIFRGALQSLTQGASPRDRPGSGKYTSIKKCLTWVRLIFARGGKSKKG